VLSRGEAGRRAGGQAQQATGRRAGEDADAVGAPGHEFNASLTARPPAGPPARPKKDWRIDLPPIPGPGLEITSPAPRLDAPPMDFETLDAVAAAIGQCQGCFLCRGRTRTVPGEGNPRARLMCVGEGPGETEDQTGRPFVGRAGELLTGILASIDLPREQVYIANVVKCRPPQNRKPLPDEMAACLPFLRRQIQLVQPRVLLALGATAAEGLLGVRQSLGQLRGKVHRWDGIPLVITYHPAALLRNPNWKKFTWDDVRIARQLLDA
jgi:uracil-DNA glycosylase family 4